MTTILLSGSGWMSVVQQLVNLHGVQTGKAQQLSFRLLIHTETLQPECILSYGNYQKYETGVWYLNMHNYISKGGLS
jgi:hypothetical protein